MSLNPKVPAWTLSFALLPIVAGVWLVTYHNAHYGEAGNAAECKQNAHAIQLALERYAVDDPGGGYPLTLSRLRDTAYLPELPRNPHRDRASGEFRPMPEVLLGEHAPGGVTYEPRTEKFYDKASGETRTVVTSFHLMVYGDDSAARRMRRTLKSLGMQPPGSDEQSIPWDYVLIELDSGTYCVK